MWMAAYVCLEKSRSSSSNAGLSRYTKTQFDQLCICLLFFSLAFKMTKVGPNAAIVIFTFNRRGG